jgi:hypothetical protein
MSCRATSCAMFDGMANPMPWAWVSPCGLAAARRDADELARGVHQRAAAVVRVDRRAGLDRAGQRCAEGAGGGWPGDRPAGGGRDALADAAGQPERVADGEHYIACPGLVRVAEPGRLEPRGSPARNTARSPAAKLPASRAWRGAGRPPAAPGNWWRSRIVNTVTACPVTNHQVSPYSGPWGCMVGAVTLRSGLRLLATSQRAGRPRLAEIRQAGTAEELRGPPLVGAASRRHYDGRT